MSDRPEWFAPRRYGIGPGLPIAWQGWALSATVMAVLTLAFFMLENNDRRALAILVPVVLGYVIITAWTTRGEWRWRWGDED